MLPTYFKNNQEPTAASFWL